MSEYVVVVPCYVPVGDGLQFKQVGQRVDLAEVDAKVLEGYVMPAKFRDGFMSVNEIRELESWKIPDE